MVVLRQGAEWNDRCFYNLVKEGDGRGERKARREIRVGYGNESDADCAIANDNGGERETVIVTVTMNDDGGGCEIVTVIANDSCGKSETIILNVNVTDDGGGYEIETANNNGDNGGCQPEWDNLHRHTYNAWCFLELR